jgi:hypothetical protein
MHTPGATIAALAGFVIGLAICGMALLTPSRDIITVQQIELRGGPADPRVQRLSPAETDLTTPRPPAGGPSTSPATPAPEPTLPDPKPAKTPIVVAPTVVSERHTAPPRATHRPTPDDDADEIGKRPMSRRPRIAPTTPGTERAIPGRPARTT